MEVQAADQTEQIEEIDAKFRAYLEHRAMLNQGELETSGRYDRAVMTLSGGAMAISLTFIEKIAPTPKEWSTWILVCAWAFLLAALGTGFHSLHSSQCAYIKERERLDEACPEPPVGLNPIAKQTNRLNHVSKWFCTIGMSLIALFAAVNII